MAKDKSFSDKTSADDKSIGFDYQYYYFLDRILNLKTGQSAGLEVKDDVHSELDADFNILYQIKHTVQKNAAGAPVALTELDGDLWKTLYNWSQVISDKTQGRKNAKEQLLYLEKTEFHLISNKTQNAANKFLSLLADFQAGDESLSVLIEHIEGLKKKTADDTIRAYIQTVRKLSKGVLEKFLRNIRFELSLDDITLRIRRSIREKIIDDNKIEQVFQRLDSNIREDNFIAVKNGKAIKISFEEFMQRYKNIFDDGRAKKLVYQPFTPQLPADIFAQKFIHRLLEIGAITPKDEELAISYTTQKLRISTFLLQWLQTGDLVVQEVNEFHDDVFLRWQNEFLVAFHGCNTPQEVVDSALKLLTLLRRERFPLGGGELDTKLSNGELYYLSDIEQIGWHQDWKSK